MEDNSQDSPNTNPNITLLDAYKAGSEEVCDNAEEQDKQLFQLVKLIKKQREDEHLVKSADYLFSLIIREIERVRGKLARYHLRAHARQDEFGGSTSKGYKVLDYQDWITLKNYLEDRNIHVDSKGELLNRIHPEGSREEHYQDVMDTGGFVEDQIVAEVGVYDTGVVINDINQTITLPLKVWMSIQDTLLDNHLTLDNSGRITESS
jgi:hypothetical protein